jgi:hypothetical protein
MERLEFRRIRPDRGGFDGCGILGDLHDGERISGIEMPQLIACNAVQM